MGSLSPEERPVIGQLANEIRAYIESRIEEARNELIKKKEVKNSREKSLT